MMISIFLQKSNAPVKIFAQQGRDLQIKYSTEKESPRDYGPWIFEIGLDDVVIVVNTSLNEKKNTFGFAEGTATQAFDLPNQSGIPRRMTH